MDPRNRLKRHKRVKVALEASKNPARIVGFFFACSIIPVAPKMSIFIFSGIKDSALTANYV